jgi:transposase
MSGPACFVGIDVAKATLECAVLPTGESWQLANEDAAFAALVAKLRDVAPERIVLEAPGGFEHGVAALAAAQLPVVVANPRQVRDLAARAVNSRRPTVSMRGSWRFSPSGCNPHSGRFPSRRLRRWMRFAHAAPATP